MTLQVPKEFKADYEQANWEQRAGLFVWPSLAGTVLSDEERRLLSLYKPSGVVLFRRSLKSLSQARELCEEISLLTSAPHQPRGAVIAIDEEGGRVFRLPPPFPRNSPASEFAHDESEDSLRSQVILQASVARSIGVSCMLAPVADVLTRPDNPAIGDRAFSSDPSVVIRCCSVVVSEIAAAGLMSCLKHFPGHGDTETDSHKGFATTQVDLDTMRQREWVPFRQLVNDCGVPLIMTAHVVCSQLDPAYPATLSSIILQKHLRDELSFSGLILSDDLRMNAISEHYGVKKTVTAAAVDDGQNSDDVEDDSFLKIASVDALRAGCDILLSCQSIVREQTALEAVKEALISESGEPRFAEKGMRIISLLKKRVTRLPS
jgi:beta-N-acetylhexosaminidase